MKPIDQTILAPPNGDCLRACVASVFELALDEVPHFCGDHRACWFEALRDWCRQRGFNPMLIHPDVLRDDPRGVCIVSGKSPRGDWLHSVVYRDGALAHDPHPSRAGVPSATDVLFFVPLDPSCRELSRAVAAERARCERIVLRFENTERDLALERTLDAIRGGA